MTALPDFRLETHFSRWEFKARYHLTASDAESLSLRELLAMAPANEREDFDNLWLGYTETFGAPDLRESIAAMYQGRQAREILCFAGASEGIFAANTVLLDAGSHAIVVTPNYQSHETLPLAICEASGVPLEADDREVAARTPEVARGGVDQGVGRAAAGAQDEGDQQQEEQGEQAGLHGASSGGARCERFSPLLPPPRFFFAAT